MACGSAVLRARGAPPGVPAGRLAPRTGRRRAARGGTGAVRRPAAGAAVRAGGDAGRRPCLRGGPEERADLRMSLPLQLFLFADGLFVTAAAPEHEALLGAQVLAFDGEPVERVVSAVDRTIGRDNEHGPTAVVPWRLVRTAFLHGLGMVGDPASVTLTVRSPDGTTRTVPVAAQPAPATLPRVLPCPAGWRFLPETLTEPLPLYLRNCGASYWYTSLAPQRLTYFQLNRVADDPGEPLAAFVER